MKNKLLLSLGLLLAVASTAQAQIVIIGGTYTADLNCIAKTNAEVDAILAAQANYLERGPTVTPAGTHPFCTLALHYDQINILGIPQTSHPDEQTHLMIDLKPKAGFTCPNAIGAPLMSPSTKVSFIPLMHQSDASFVAQSKLAFGYNAFPGYFARNHSVGATSWTASPTNPGFDYLGLLPDASNQLSFQATYHTRVALNAAGIANQPHLSASLDAPVFGNVAGVPAWNVVKWNATVANVKSQNANLFWSSSLLPTPVMVSNVQGLNSDPVGAVHFEATPFTASLPVNCL